LQRIPSASSQAKSPHSTERTVSNALCGMQALGVFTAATKLVVSNLGIVFDNLLIFNDLINIVGDLIYIAKNMPIPAT
jgi:hypothetical protein